MTATKVETLKCCSIQVDGSGIDSTLHKVKYVPKLWVNLLCIYKALKKGYKLSNKGLYICISKRAVFATFGLVKRTTNDSVSGLKLAKDDASVACNEIGCFTLGKSIT